MHNTADIPEPSLSLTMINELFYNSLWDANHSIQEIIRIQESTSHNFISGFLVSPLWNTRGSSNQFSFSHSP